MSGHSAAGRRCAPGARWNSRDGSPDDGESVQHGDLGPWNPLWGPAAGVIDWDLVEPGDPCYDTGFLAWFTVPFMDDSRACARGFPSPPERWARLSAFASGAGLDPSRVLGLGFAAQREFAARVVTRGLEPWPTLLSMGTREPARSELEWTRANLSSDRR
jgi:aminoglycoside phosphotransferase (APT) family kinase protein